MVGFCALVRGASVKAPKIAYAVTSFEKADGMPLLLSWGRHHGVHLAHKLSLLPGHDAAGVQ